MSDFKTLGEQLQSTRAALLWLAGEVRRLKRRLATLEEQTEGEDIFDRLLLMNDEDRSPL